MVPYPVIIYPCEEGGFVAEIPALKGCLAQGESLMECLQELDTVSALWVETAMQHNIPLPDSEKLIKRLRAAMQD